MTKDEYRIINQLVDIENKIKHLYYKLYQLELSMKTKEFDKTFSELEEYLKIEAELYSSLEKDNKTNNNILNYFIENYRKQIESNNFFKQLISFDDLIIILRIISRLSKNYIDDFSSKLNNQEYQFFSSIDNGLKAKRNILLDILRCFISIVESKKELDNKEFLKRPKYVVSYLYPDIEKEMVNSSFKINSNTYISYKMFCQINGWPKEMIKTITNLYCSDFYISTINSMLQYFDENLTDSYIKSELIVSQSFLRAIFIFLDDEIIMELNNILHDMIDDEEAHEFLKNKDKIIEIIIEAYRKVKTDRSIPKIILLKAQMKS